MHCKLKIRRHKAGTSLTETKSVLKVATPFETIGKIFAILEKGHCLNVSHIMYQKCIEPAVNMLPQKKQTTK